ncbi:MULTISPECIES: hypothetical protein [unclassified Methanoculleus]|uniref:hypothetical protein n=1 Tax=unclassified Methanoculleus TaxID=2619537 RepID=UPI00049EE843|nr:MULTISPECIES: hypothetical protein [unclassified Methanoculleus]KDE55334.1 hypothetical protein EI28_07630 [Methanoculleus sp. MH98A]
MPVEVDGRLIDDTTIQLDRPPKPGEERVAVRLRKHPKMTKLPAPEEYILKLAEKDLEELYLADLEEGTVFLEPGIFRTIRS